MSLRNTITLVMVLTIGNLSLAQTTFTFRSGQSAGVPGNPGDVDDNFTALVGSGGVALPFTPVVGVGGGACAAAPSYLISPVTPPWAPGLGCDPDARWINGLPGAFSSVSVLYGTTFTVASPSAATLDFCWLVDDALGDPIAFGGSNLEGVYINGNPVAGTSGGTFSVDTSLTGIPIPAAYLNSGTNCFEVYQRDVGFSVSGVIFSGTLTIATPAPGASTWSLTATFIGMLLVAAAVLGRSSKAA